MKISTDEYFSLVGEISVFVFLDSWANPDCRHASESLMTRALTFVLFVAVAVLMARGQETNDTQLLETGRSAKPEKLVMPSKDISMVSYNIRWRTGDELKKISDWLIEKRPCASGCCS